MVKKLLNCRSIFLASIILAVLFYSGFLPEAKNRGSIFNSVFSVEEICSLKGKVVSTPVKSQNSGNYSVMFSPSIVYSKIGNGSSKGEVVLLLPSESVECWFPGKLYSSSNKTGSILCDEGANLYVQGHFLSCESKDEKFFLVNNVVQLSWGEDFWGILNYYRSLFRLYLKRLLYGWGDSGALLLALITGMKEYVNPEINEGFRNAGLSHILALSGMHLSLFSGMALFISKIISGNRTVRHVFQFIVIVIFVYFAGKTPSLYRSLLCSTFCIILKCAGIKKYKMINVLSLAFIVHICVFPADMKSLAFILSYGALAGILLFSQPICRKMTFFLPEKISSAFSASVSAQLVTCPVQICFFGTFTPVGILASVVVSPLITLFIYAGLAFTVLSLIFPFLSQFTGFVLDVFYKIIVAIVLFFSSAKPLSF